VEDADILKRIKNGDTNAYSEIVHKYHRHLLNFIYAYVGDERIVEDIGQETFISAFKSISEFDLKRGTPFSAWLYTIAKNRCIYNPSFIRYFFQQDDSDGLMGRTILIERIYCET
jgi:RNA polymerase sigma-70 factor (ECF subfamily)